MSSRVLATGVATSLAVLVLASPAGASRKPITIDFEKDCPQLTCEATAASPVDVSTSISVKRFEGGVLHYTGSETVSSAAGSLTMQLAGVLNFNTDPDLTIVRGRVVVGTWNGVDLRGARLHVSAVRRYGTVFGGTITILPASTG